MPIVEKRNVIGETTRCMHQSCNGWIVDSFSGKYWIKCVDPKHNKIKAVGSPNPAAQHKAIHQSDDGLSQQHQHQPHSNQICRREDVHYDK
jgi:hypothetical protein